MQFIGIFWNVIAIFVKNINKADAPIAQRILPAAVLPRSALAGGPLRSRHQLGKGGVTRWCIMLLVQFVVIFTVGWGDMDDAGALFAAYKVGGEYLTNGAIYATIHSGSEICAGDFIGANDFVFFVFENLL